MLQRAAAAPAENRTDRLGMATPPGKDGFDLGENAVAAPGPGAHAQAVAGKRKRHVVDVRPVVGDTVSVAADRLDGHLYGAAADGRAPFLSMAGTGRQIFDRSSTKRA